MDELKTMNGVLAIGQTGEKVMLGGMHQLYLRISASRLDRETR
jgi:hypothetical protein